MKNTDISFLFHSCVYQRFGRNYVKLSIYLFVFVPIIIAFFIGIVLYLYVLTSSEELNDRELYNMEGDEPFKKFKESSIEVLKTFQRPSWIIGFCSSLMFCLIVIPSVLWIKVYLTLAFISITMQDISMRLQHKIEDEKRNYKQTIPYKSRNRKSKNGLSNLI